VLLRKLAGARDALADRVELLVREVRLRPLKEIPFFRASVLHEHAVEQLEPRRETNVGHARPEEVCRCEMHERVRLPGVAQVRLVLATRHLLDAHGIEVTPLDAEVDLDAMNERSRELRALAGVRLNRDVIQEREHLAVVRLQ
jgi:hypothetical protein